MIPELLAPAGSMEKLKVALAYGADAVYLGGKNFGLRAFSENFTFDELREACDYVHKNKRKMYVTVNAFPHHQDLEQLSEYLLLLNDIACDGILVADPGVFVLAQDLIPDIPLHISTQANTVNWMAARFWENLGAQRVVLARELSLTEIKQIRQKVNLELESFVHGAMCISYSGRCLMSAYMTGRHANRGECAQPCRWKYALQEETRPGEYFPIEEDERGTYILNSRDLCLIEKLPELAAAGVQSFKIEGRMKSVHYIATVVRIYREAIDSLSFVEEYAVKEHWRDELEKIATRRYTKGFWNGQPCHDGQEYDSIRLLPEWEYAGQILTWHEIEQVAIVEQRNHLQVGDEIEILRPNQEVFRQKLATMSDIDGHLLTTAPHPRQILRIRLDQPAGEYAMIRRRRRVT